MNDFPKRQLLINYLLGICTPDQQEEIEYWLDKKPDNISLLQKIGTELGQKQSLTAIEKENLKCKIIRTIEEQENYTDGHIQEEVKGTSGIMTYSSYFANGGLWVKAAAIILIIITVGVIGFYYNNITLSHANSEVELQKRTLSNGQTATVRLGDGSVVNLNGGSTLRYPKEFAQDKREVYLKGEAFFSVTCNDRPFIVHAGNTVTQVLGTSFNVRSYGNEDYVQVVVEEGKVVVSSNKNDNETIFLTKDQWVNYRSTGQLIEKGEGDISELIAWKDRKLVFVDKRLDHITNRLERWYNIEVVLRDSSLASRRMTASFSEESMREVLTVIALSLDVQYKKEGRKIIFHKKNE